MWVHLPALLVLVHGRACCTFLSSFLVGLAGFSPLSPFPFSHASRIAPARGKGDGSKAATVGRCQDRERERDFSCCVPAYVEGEEEEKGGAAVDALV